jgi:hypothetical protein
LLPLPWDVKRYDFDFKIADFTHPATAPYGSVESAFLVLQVWVKHLDGSLRLEEIITCYFSPFYSCRLAESKRTTADFLLSGDITDDTELIRSVIEGQTRDKVYLLELVPHFLQRRSPFVGLVLKGYSDGPMSRIELYVFYSDEVETLEIFYGGLVEDCRLM